MQFAEQLVNSSFSRVKGSLLDFPYKGNVMQTATQKKTIPPGSRSKTVRKKERSGKTYTIGVVVHELQSDFIKAALTGIESVITQSGYRMIITHSQESMEKEVANVQMLLAQKVDGLIASLSFDTTSLDHFTSFFNHGVPVVFFDRVAKTGGQGMVVIDNVNTGYIATRHLIQQGCRRIAIVTSSLERNVYADRYKGFRNALCDNNIPFDDELLIINNIQEEAGIEAARQVMSMKKRPDGLFITNDLVAAVCMHALLEAGVRVPEDIAIVGFNNDSICKLTDPSISTINYPGLQIGQLAAARLLDSISGNCACPAMNTAVVPAELIIRHSSLKGIQRSKNACR